MAVRREKVILELDDQLSTGMVRAAASSALLDKALDRSSTSVKRFGRDSDAAGREIDRLSGRVRIFADLAAILGPTVSPLGASLVTPLVGLTNQFGFAAIAGGTALLAFQGVGDALKAMNEYGHDPSQANAEKLAEKMGTLDGSTQAFVKTLHDLGPEIDRLQAGAARGLFPGLTAGLDNLETRLPEVQGIIATVSSTLGDLLAEAGENLASDGWDEWFATVQREATPALNDMGHSLGNVVAGLADMWQAFMPLSRDFSTGMLDMSRSFHAWAEGLDDSQSFQDFLNYVRDSGPQVLDTLGALGGMLLQIAQAAAPLGGPILKGIEAFADAVSAIADSDLGTPIFAGLAALAAWNRAVGIATAASGAFTKSRLAMGAAQRAGLTTMKADAATFLNFGAMTRAEVDAQKTAGANLRSTFLKTGAAAAGLGLAMSPLPEQVGLSNTAMFAMTGMLAGPWGAAVGGGVGLLMDLVSANKESEQAERATTDAIKSGSRERIAARIEELQALEARRKAEQDSGVSTFRNLFTGGDDGNAKQIDRLNEANRKVAASARETRLQLNRAYGDKIPDAAMLSTVELQQKVAELRKTAHETSTAFITLGDSLNDSKVSLGSWIQDMQEQANALRDFRVNAQKAANQGLRQGLIAALQEAGPEGAMRMKQLANATDAEIRKANRAWIAGQREIKKYDDAVGGVPTAHGTNLFVRTGRAYWEIERIQNAVRALRDRTITITTHIQQTGGRLMGGQSADAYGGIHFNNVRAYAYGDIANNHQPELAGPGPTRVWREPETMGEAYIPLANDHRRPRARSIAAETVRLLGGTAHFATGGFTRAEYNRAAGNFDIRPGMSFLEARRELIQFSREVRRAGGTVGRNFSRLSKEIETTATSYNRARKSLDDLRSARDDARSNAANLFNNDVFSGNLADLRRQLSADTNDAKAFDRTIDSLQGRQGLDGGLLKALTASGNLALAQELQGLSRSQVTALERQFGQRASAQSALGAEAASHFTAEINRYSREVTRLGKKIDRLEGAVERGARRGVNDRKKSSNARGHRK